jgi:hypothetical protein
MLIFIIFITCESLLICHEDAIVNGTENGSTAEEIASDIHFSPNDHSQTMKFIAID